MFFVNLVNKLGWSSVVAVRPRNLFAMLEAENEGDMKVDLLDVRIQDMNLLGQMRICQIGQDQTRKAQLVMPLLLIRCVAKQFSNQMMRSYLMRMMMTKMTPTLMMELLHQLW